MNYTVYQLFDEAELIFEYPVSYRCSCSLEKTKMLATQLTEEELKSAINKSKKVDYGWLFNTRYELLRKAYSRFSKDKEYEEFCRNNIDWLDDYALFMSLKVQHGYSEWTSWGIEYQDYEHAKSLAYNYTEEMDFWRFIQFEFYKQWDKLHKYVKSLGIEIIGDTKVKISSVDEEETWDILDEKSNEELETINTNYINEEITK